MAQQESKHFVKCADSIPIVLRLEFAWLGLKERFPKSGEQDMEDVAVFLNEIDHTPTLRALSGLPFYCDLLLQQHRVGGLKDFADDVALLNHVIDEMVDREVKKGLLDLRLFEPDGLFEWLEQIAVDYVEGQKYSDIGRDAAMEYGELILRAGLDDKTKHHILTSLLQFPLFRAGKKTGLVAFAHDLIAETLPARAYRIRSFARCLSKLGLLAFGSVCCWCWHGFDLDTG